VVSIKFGLERGNIQGNKLRDEIGPKPIKQKANLGASYNVRVRRIPALAEYCFIAQAQRLDRLSHRRREAPSTPAEFLDIGRIKEIQVFRVSATSRLNRCGPLFREKQSIA